jgi:hypothetical protein
LNKLVRTAVLGMLGWGVDFAAQPNRPVQIVEVGNFHGSDVPFSTPGEGWIGLFPVGHSLVWRPTKLMLKYVQDEVAEDAPGVLTGKELYIGGSPAPRLLIRGLPGLVGQRVTPVWSESERDSGDLNTGIRRLELVRSSTG